MNFPGIPFPTALIRRGEGGCNCKVEIRDERVQLVLRVKIPPPIQQRAKHVCVLGMVHFSAVAVGQNTRKDTPPFNTPLLCSLTSLTHYNYTLLFFIQSNSTRDTFISFPRPHTVHFSVFCVEVFIA